MISVAKCVLLSIVAASFLVGPSFAQNATGTPPLSTISAGPADSIDLANLNVHLNIPIFLKAGRGAPFNYTETYDGLIWSPVTSGSTTSWQPASGWGWSAQSTALTGSVIFLAQYLECAKTVNGELEYLQYQVITWQGYTDPGGTYHRIVSFPTTLGEPSCNTPVQEIATGSGNATDGSGYTVSVAGVDDATVRGPNGVVIQAPGYTASTIADNNGNYFTTNISGSTTSYTDTLGTTPLTVTVVSSTQTTYAYTAPSGATAKYTFNYSTGNTVTTSFGCTSISEYSNTNVTQLTSIVLPDTLRSTVSYMTRMDASNQSPFRLVGRSPTPIRAECATGLL